MNRFDRQSFLGPNSESQLFDATIGLVGLGGGGSHVAQQLGHLGIGGYVGVDPDHITITNTNRLISGTLDDVKRATSKVDIAERQIRRLMERPRIITDQGPWQSAINHLKRCDVIVGSVDSFVERDQLERFARRHLIPYIDIGMDVHKLADAQFLIGGQVFLSMPGRPCLHCCGILTNEKLTQEAGKYGAAGSMPQVVWSNGVLASTAVGLVTQLLTPWFNNSPDFVYLDYDGNLGTLTPNERMRIYEGRVCKHHPATEVGDALFDVRNIKRESEKLSNLPNPNRSAKPKFWFSFKRSARRTKNKRRI